MGTHRKIAGGKQRAVMFVVFQVMAALGWAFGSVGAADSLSEPPVDRISDSADAACKGLQGVFGCCDSRFRCWWLSCWDR